MAKIETLKDKVLAKQDLRERATFKGREIAKVCRPKTEKRGDLDIEITEIVPMEGGITVFARAYKNGKQLGFGADGSVDIERFRIFNPPILVPDGTKRDIEIDGKQTQVDNFVENPEEALMQALTDTIKVLKPKSDKNIVAGKVGNTVSTFYSDTGDGSIRASNASFSTARSATTGTVQGGSSHYLSCGLEGGSTYNFYMGFFMFDTSAIGASDTISDAVFSLYLVGDNAGTAGNQYGVTQSKQATWNSLASGDFDDRRDSISSGTEGATRKNRATGSTSGYEDFTLNATGRGWIARSGETKPASASASGKTQLSLAWAKDIDNSAPTTNDYNQVYSADQTGTSNDPKLVVTHSSAVDVTVNATVVTATSSIPAPVVSGGATVSQGTPPVSTFSTPAPAISGGASVSPNALTATFSIPAPNIITPDAQVDAGVLTATLNIPAPSVSGGANVDATVLTATFSQPASSVQIDATIAAGVLVATFTIPAPVVSGISNITVSPSALTATFSIPAPTVTTEQNAVVDAGVLTATFTTPAVTVTAIMNVTVSASVVVATFSVNTPSKVGGLWTAQPRVNGDAAWTPQPRAV